MRKMQWITGLLLALWVGLNFQPARAASGLPNSPRFGYGGRVSSLTPPMEAYAQPIQLAAQNNLDWFALDYDWAAYTPTSGSPNLEVLDIVMGFASQNGLHVLVSVTHAPAWSLEAAGPNPAAVTDLCIALAERYPGVLLAIELFPAANTAHGWGAAANPAAYTQMMQSVRAALDANALDIALVVAGLTPLPANPAPGDMGDLDFLAGLYQAGAQASMPIISLRLPAVAGTPLTVDSPDSLPTLRHFEAIRQMMLDHNHANGLIWITEFVWPAEMGDPQEQAQWLAQAYELLQAHLYLGAAFFNLLPTADGQPALISMQGQPHPGLQALAQIIETCRAQLPAYALKKIVRNVWFKPQKS
jgi:hypothetical protein